MLYITVKQLLTKTELIYIVFCNTTVFIFMKFAHLKYAHFFPGVSQDEFTKPSYLTQQAK